VAGSARAGSTTVEPSTAGAGPIGPAAVPDSVPADRQLKTRPQFVQLRGQPTDLVSHVGQRPGGENTSSRVAIGPRAAPNTNQSAHGRARRSASQLARGANRIAETMNGRIGNENPDKLPPRQPAGRAGAMVWGDAGRRQRLRLAPNSRGGFASRPGSESGPGMRASETGCRVGSPTVTTSPSGQAVRQRADNANSR
jgi:hypothetical protein